MATNNNIGYIINEASAKNVEFKIKNEQHDRVIAEGIIQTAEQENRNKRCYTLADLTREIASPRTTELISTGNMYGEAGHPREKDLARQSTICVPLIQVRYTKIWMDGNNVMAHFMGTNNDLGKSFDQDLRMGTLPSFSLRALGAIENRNGKAYVKNLKVITWDRVVYPSHPTAYTTGIVSESADASNYSYRAPDIVKEMNNELVVQEGYQIVTPIKNQSVRDYLMQESANLQTIINTFDTLYQTITLSEDAKTVTLVDSDYNKMVVRLENHIQNEIMDYCLRL